jgi:IclR family acetate operon transcriptional repressor
VQSSSPRYLVPVLQSAFRLIEEVSRAGTLSLNEAVLRTGIPKSTVFRVFSTLQHLGVLIRDEAEKTYRLGYGVPGLLTAGEDLETLRRAALPQMISLRDLFGETVNLGKLQHDKVVYLEVVPSESALRFSERPGATVAVHASALGRAILAFSPPSVVDGLIAGRPLAALTAKTITDEALLRAELATVRRLGYSIEVEESALQATCVGAPILNAHGEAVAALSISGPIHRFRPQKDKKIIAALRKAAAEISGVR